MSCNWFNIGRIEINDTKSKVLIYRIRNDHYNKYKKIWYCGNNLEFEQVDNFKYLGLITQSNNKNTIHFDKLCKNVAHKRYIFHKLKLSCNLKELLIIFNSHFRSIIEYGNEIIIWNKQHLLTLEVQQCKILRILYGNKHNIGKIEWLYGELGIEYIEQRAILSKLIFLKNILDRNNKNEYIYNILNQLWNCNDKNNNTLYGNNNNNWIKYIKKYFILLNINHFSFQDIELMDKKDWHNLITNNIISYFKNIWNTNRNKSNRTLTLYNKIVFDYNQYHILINKYNIGISNFIFLSKIRGNIILDDEKYYSYSTSPHKLNENGMKICNFCNDLVNWNVNHLCLECNNCSYERNTLINSLNKYFTSISKISIWNTLTINEKILTSLGKYSSLHNIYLNNKNITEF